MTSTKDTHIYSDNFLKLEVALAFLKFVEITMASIQLTLTNFVQFHRCPVRRLRR
jgi:hypothetical protein